MSTKPSTDPITGEDPMSLSMDPWSYYVGPTSPLGGESGGGVNHQNYSAFRDFVDLFGRNPTKSELGMLSPAYAGDPNYTNDSVGKRAVSQYYNQFTNSPDNLEKQKQNQYAKDAPQYYDQINGQFQSTLGRDATQEEKDHFAKLISSGQADPYTVGTFLGQLPEAVTKQDAQFRSQLSDTTKTEDARYFNEQLLPGIQSNFSKSGRSFDSSGFANAAAQAGQQQNTAREGFLNNLTASQYQGNKTAAYNDYLNSVGRIQAGQDYSRNRSAQLQDQLTSTLNDDQNFQMQKQAYDQYLQRYGKRSSTGGIGSLVGGALGAGLGFSAGGMSGAAAGYGIGSGFGGGAGSMWG